MIVELEGKLTETIANETGISQGDSLRGEKEIQIVCYANDTIIIPENVDDLQRLMKQFGRNGNRI